MLYIVMKLSYYFDIDGDSVTGYPTSSVNSVW